MKKIKLARIYQWYCSSIKMVFVPPVVAILFGCNSAAQQNNNEPILSDFDQEIALAITKQDFSLYGTSGRRVTLPGVNMDEYDYVKAHCGIKHLPNAGDVIRSEEQRIARKKVVDYMMAYNKQMLGQCRTHNK